MIYTNWPWLPIELYVHILSFLPPTRGLDDASVKTLVNCLSANSHLRAAALQPGLWEPHYRVRYTHCVEKRERQRQEELNGNWASMYAARRALDRAALQLVDSIRLQLIGRHEKARILVRDYSFDVWDALELESQMPLPAFLRDEPAPERDAETGGGEGEDAVVEQEEIPHALPRRYWARTVMGVIARHQTIEMWARLFADEEDESITFEEALTGLSAFFDVSPKQISSWLNGLAEQCREALIDQGVELDPHAAGYVLADTCVHIRTFMRSVGFRHAGGIDFYNLLNQFPHGFMQEENRRTIPMSLVYVFVAIGRRLGVQAAPTNYPGKVLCHITPVDPAANEMLMDLCGDARPMTFRSRELPEMLAEVGLPPDLENDPIRPCPVSLILQRAASNVIVAVRWSERRVPSMVTETFAWCSYAASCVQLLIVEDHGVLGETISWKPLDAIAVLTDAMCPALVPTARDRLKRHCVELVRQEERGLAVVRERSSQKVKYFVGMVVQHDIYDYVGCVTEWHPKRTVYNDYLPPIEESGKAHRGFNQPFYWLITVDGAKRYVAEDNISPAVLDQDSTKRITSNHSIFGRYFEGIEVNKAEQRSRMLPTEELRIMFPEDDQAGALWVARGFAEEKAVLSQ